MTQPPVLQYRVSLPFAAAEQAVRDALQAEGFGILTEVDVVAVLRARLGIETKPQKLLGACNPQLAHISLEAEPSVGAFLPCGVALREGAGPSETIIAVQNPGLLAGVFAVDGLAGPAAEARERLSRALASIGSPL